MDLAAILAVSVPLLLIAVGMIVWHVRTWRSFRQQDMDAEERNYRWRQFRRRMQTSVMLALLAVAFPVGDVLTSRSTAEWASLVVFYWFGAVLLACWIVLLGLADIWATRHYFGRLRRDCLIEQIKLQAELHRAEAMRERDATP